MSPIPYYVAFVILLLLVAVLRGPKLAGAARILIVLYAVLALGLSIYYLSRKETWQACPNDGSVPDSTRYQKATCRSSAIYIIMNFLLLGAAKVLGISYSGVTYNYLSLFVTMMIAYVYDRAIATDDGLRQLKLAWARTLLDAYLVFCSPAFMRYIMVIVCEITLTIMISYYFGVLIPTEYWLAGTLFRKSVVPVVVYTVVTGPLRFAWAYPTVSEAGRIPYLLAYTIVFTLLAVITYASGSVRPSSVAGVLIMMALVAVVLQAGGLSNAPRDPDLDVEATIMPLWIMLILSTIIVISIMVIAHRVFISCLQPFIMNEPVKAEVLRSQRVLIN